LRTNLDLTQREFANCNGPTSIGAQIIKILLCPSDFLLKPQSTFTSGGTVYWFGMNSYGGNGGTRSYFVDSNYSTDGVFYLNSKVIMNAISDGTSNTFLAGERYHRDPVFNSANLGAGKGIDTLGGWAWSNYLAVQDCIGST